MGLYSLQTTAGQESTVAEMILNRGYEEIHTALSHNDMTGYIIVEAESQSIVSRAAEELPQSRKVLDGEIPLEQIEHLLEPTNDVDKLNEGAVVRLTEGPFQGEKAKITEVDESNERATVELYEATVPIPVEMRGDQLRVLDNEERQS